VSLPPLDGIPAVHGYSKLQTARKQENPSPFTRREFIQASPGPLDRSSSSNRKRTVSPHHSRLQLTSRPRPDQKGRNCLAWSFSDETPYKPTGVAGAGGSLSMVVTPVPRPIADVPERMRFGSCRCLCVRRAALSPASAQIAPRSSALTRLSRDFSFAAGTWTQRPACPRSSLGLSIIPAPTVLFVCRSMRMKAPATAFRW
jgi:hypothetical protein